MQTIEQKREVFVRAFFKGLWPADCFEPLDIYEETGKARTGPARNPDGLRNLELLQKEINAIPAEDEVDLDYARKIFFRLRDIGNVLKQTLVRKPTAVVFQAPLPIDPKTQIPHRELFPQITGIESCIRFVKTSKLPSSQTKQINELLAYLKQHDIHDEDFVDEVRPARVVTAPRARAIVDSLRVGDIGSSNSSSHGGKWDQLIGAQKKLHQYVDSLVAQRLPESKIIDLVRAEVDKLNSRSIR